MSYTTGATALKMPSNYVPLTEEEMTYVDGGYTFLCDEWLGWHKRTRSDVGASVELVGAIAEVFLVFSAGVSFATALQKYGIKIMGEKVLSTLQKIGIRVVVTNNMIDKASRGMWNPGYGIAYIADCCDRGGCDGYVEWYGWSKY